MKLSNKTILITGGTSGIGKSLAKALLKHNNRVIVIGRNKKQLELARTEGFEAFHCDLSSQDDMENLVMQLESRFGYVDALFNNAGMQENYAFTDAIIPLDKVRREVEVNLNSQIILTHLMIPLLNNSREALIVNTTSGLAYFPKENGLVYSASKAGFRNFSQGLRISLQNTPIKVVEFIPPVTASAMTAGRDEKKMSSDELVFKVLPQIERGRKVATVFTIRMFRWIAFLSPKLAHKILSK